MRLDPDKTYKCYNCGEEVRLETKIGRRDTCPNCYAYLHCCYNCRHWDPMAHNECRESPSEYIRDRSEGNFCLYFDFKPVGEDTSSEVDQAKDTLQKMFGKAKGIEKRDPEKDDPKKKLEAVFKKKK